ncbi:MAG TPA: prepilin peptidase [Solirubrobacteraceae bacterium]|jgi:leader peptidase (prepilin peptidase)/N-methyltransferase|nr:prepilin peptidase [Solirubrobacteraceae bacterium]
MTTPEHTATAPAPAMEAIGGAPLLSMPGLVAPFVVAAIALALGAYPLGGTALLAAFVAAVLVVLAAIDLERRIVPNRIVLPAAAVALLGHIALTPGDAAQYALAALLAALFLFLPRLFNPKALGMGDVKLGLLIGAALGWSAASALALGFLLVFPVALAIAIRGGAAAARRATIPMCPFLALGALVVLLGPGLVGS